MSTTAESVQLYCANCSDPVDTVDWEQNGRCCQNLPNPWCRGSDGLYTQPSESRDAESEDVDQDERPECPFCDGRRFTIQACEWRQVRLATTVSGLNDDYEDSTLWYYHSDFDDEGTIQVDGFEIHRVVCAGCSSDVTDHVHVEQR